MSLFVSKKIYHSFRFDEKTSEQGNILHGVIVCEVGEAKGHDFFLSEEFLQQVVKLTEGKPIKVRIDHPEEGKPGKVLSIIGRATNFRMDGDKVRADIEIFDLPAKGTILKLAKQAGDLFGMSLDFVGKIGKKLKGGLSEIFCKAVNAVDFVEAPAATTSLFTRLVDSPQSSMTITLPGKIVQLLGLRKNPDEKEVIAAIGNYLAEKNKKMDAAADNKLEGGDETEKEAKSVSSVLGELRGHLEAMNEDVEMDDESKGHVEGALAALNALGKHFDDTKEEGDEDKEKMADESDKKDEGEEKVESYSRVDKHIKDVAAREVTRLLAKSGRSIKLGEAKDQDKADEKKDESDLTSEQKTICKTLGLDEKAYAKTLLAAKGSQAAFKL